MKSWNVGLMLAIAMLITNNASWATPHYFPGNGHWYEVVPDFTYPDWSEARELAETYIWQGNHGYLACITSAEENLFIYDLTLGTGIWHTATIWEIGPWLGGYQLEGSAEPDEGWVWISDEPWVYSAWFDGQPNDDGWMGQNEMALCYWGYAGHSAPTWNDYTDSPPYLSGGRVYGYVVEFDESSTPVEDTTWGRVKAILR